MLAGHALLFEINVEMRAAVKLQSWIRNMMLNRKLLQKQNVAALKIQAAVRGYLVRKKLPQIKYELHLLKLVRAATLIQVIINHKKTYINFIAKYMSYSQTKLIKLNFLQALWRGYSVRKRYQCRRETIRVPKKGALTLGKRHNDVVNILNRQKKNEYSYRELATVFWNLGSVI